MTKHKIIVTGGSGFLGKHLCRALMTAGYEVKNIDLRPNDEVPTVIADIRDTEAMKAEIRDAFAVFHLAGLIEAGESVKFPGKFIDYNINGMLSVLEAMRVNEVKTIIFSSSAAVYGNPLSVPIKEDDRMLPISPYGVTKLAMEGLLSSYVEAYQFTGVALRYFNLYGPEENHIPETHAIPRFIQQINEGKEVTIWGDGEYKRDYVYITDVVKAHLKALEYAEKHLGAYQYFNLSSEVAPTVLEVIRLIEKHLGKTAVLKHFPPRAGDPRVLVASSEKSKQLLGWSSSTLLDEGIKNVVEYFLKSWSTHKN